MKHTVHTDELSVIRSDYQKNLRYICETVLMDIVSEMLRLGKEIPTIALSLHPTFVAVSLQGSDVLTADLENAEQLINLLRHLEETTGKEEHTDAEALS